MCVCVCVLTVCARVCVCVDSVCVCVCVCVDSVCVCVDIVIAQEISYGVWPYCEPSNAAHICREATTYSQWTHTFLTVLEYVPSLMLSLNT